MRYRNYIADSIFMYAQNKRLTQSFRQMGETLYDNNRKTGDEIALEVIRNAGLKVG